MRASGHHALITGGGSGIGLALAARFHAAGNAVTLCGRREELLREAAAQLPGARWLPCDVATPEGRAALVTTAQATGVTVLVHNAAVQSASHFVDMDDAELEREVATNLTAPLLLTRALLAHLQSQPEAAVVHVTSGLALVPKASAPVYCATKAALRSAAISLRWQLAGTPVRVFELLPPMVRTPMSRYPGRWAITPEAVAAAFWRAWLANRSEVPVGLTRALPWLQRASRTLAERLVRGAP